MVIATLYVVLLLAIEAREVEATVMTRPVGVGIVFVLLRGPVIWERSITAITIRHQIVVVQSKDDYGVDPRIYIEQTVSRMFGHPLTWRSDYSICQSQPTNLI